MTHLQGFKAITADPLLHLSIFEIYKSERSFRFFRFFKGTPVTVAPHFRAGLALVSIHRGLCNAPLFS